MGYPASLSELAYLTVRLKKGDHMKRVKQFDNTIYWRMIYHLMGRVL